jgi:hypothetical protein
MCVMRFQHRAQFGEPIVVERKARGVSYFSVNGG